MGNNHFTVLVPSYNVEKWAPKSVLSVLNQNYDNFDLFYIDDCSTDKTVDVIQDLIVDSACNITFEKNSFNRGKMHNVHDAVHSMKDGTIVVILDGDDWLANENVLNYLNDVYDSGDVWMTNGSYIIEPSSEIVRPKINESYWSGNIRAKTWEFSHLGTFRKELFCRIKRKDLMSRNGEYWSTTSDQAIMWPMAEMSGPENFRSIDEVLYVYNRLNPLSDDRAHRTDQLTTERIIRNKKPYVKLDTI